MAFLTIAGANYWVLETGATENEPETAGESRRAIDGTLRKGERWYKRTFQFTLEPLTSAAYETLQAACRAGTFLTIGGDACPAGDYDVRVTGAAYQWISGTTFKRGPSITLRQV